VRNPFSDSENHRQAFRAQNVELNNEIKNLQNTVQSNLGDLASKMSQIESKVKQTQGEMDML